MHELSTHALITGWVNVSLYVFFIRIFYKSCKRTQNDINKLFRVLILLIDIISIFTSIIGCLSSYIEIPYSIQYNPIVIQYMKWLFTTPLIILCLSLLEHISYPETIMIVSLDILTMVSGLISNLSNNPMLFWSYFGFGCICWSFTNYKLLSHTFNYYSDKITIYHINNYVFTILVVGITIIWNIYPIFIILEHLHIISYSDFFIVNIVLDFFSKNIFGVLLIGAKEIEEGIESRLTMLSKSIIKVYPSTLEPVIEDNIKIIVKHTDTKEKRKSIYLYTPPLSETSLKSIASEKSILSNKPSFISNTIEKDSTIYEYNSTL